MIETPPEENRTEEGAPPAEGEGPSEEEQNQTPGDAEAAEKRTFSGANAEDNVEITGGEGQETAVAMREDLGQAEVQANMDEATKKGYIGSKVDPTPDENYSVQTPPDTPTPETDADLAAEAHKAAIGDRLTNVETPSHLTAPHNAPEKENQ